MMWRGWGEGRELMPWVGLAIALSGCGDAGPGQSGSDGDVGETPVPDAGPGGGEGSDPAVIFDGSRLHAIELSLSAEDWQSILDDSRGDEWRRATLTYDGVAITDIGARPSGESSRFPGNPKMSVRLKFDAFRQTKFHGLEELKLDGLWDDPSLMRERLAYFVMRTRLPSPREVHGRLVVNGELRGVYAIEEVWDDETLKAYFPEPLGPLYRIRGLGIVLDPYAYMGPDPAVYVPLPWDPKTRVMPADHAVIPPFLRVLAEAPDTLEQVCNVDRLLEYFAANAVVTNVDGFTGSFEVDDHFQYFEPQTGRFHILPWDPDNTFGSINDPPTRWIYENFEKSIVTRLIRETPTLRRRFRMKINDTMAQIPLAVLWAKADFIYEQIRAAAYEDPKKMWPNDHFDYSLGYIKEFAAQRYADLQVQANPR